MRSTLTRWPTSTAKVGEVEVRPFSFKERQALLYLLIDTGVRRSEAAGLTLAEIHDDASLTVHGKGNRKRRISVGESARDALEHYLAVRRKHPKAPRPPIGCGSPRRARSPPTASTRWSSTAPAQPASPTSPRLRLTAAHFWLVRGGAEVDLMAHMGWSMMQMAQRYTKSAAQDHARGVHKRLALGNEHA